VFNLDMSEKVYRWLHEKDEGTSIAASLEDAKSVPIAETLLLVKDMRRFARPGIT